jgi:hypothetical protein
VSFHVERDGTLSVTEQITFAFDGDFSGAYRDLPVRPGERVFAVSVSEGRRAYAAGGCAELGCT